MEDKMEQAYRWEHGQDPTTLLDALHGSLYHRFMVTGTILADKGLFILYLLAFIMLALVLRLLDDNPRQRYVTSLLWLDVIGTFVLTFMLGGLLIYFAKHYLHIPRPFVAWAPAEISKLGPLIEKGEDYMSFPSGHAAFATMIAVSLWPALGKVGRPIACLFVLWAACSRVALGLHYPVDVLGGITISLVVALIIRTVIRHLHRRKGSPNVP